ncbi:putative acetyltransferase [Salmonella phage SPFM9]|nr:putative acetyltransferase [Salmonella phage SPFM9]
MLLTKPPEEKLLTHYAESVPIFLSIAADGQRYFRMTNYNVISSHTNIPALGFFHQQGFQIDRWYMLKYLQQNSDRKHISCRVHPTHLVYMVVPEESRRGGVGRFIKLTMFVEDDIVRGIMAWEPGVYPELVEWVRDLNSIREEPIA